MRDYRWIVALVLGSVLLVACGGDKKGDEGTTPTDLTATPDIAATMTDSGPTITDVPVVWIVNADAPVAVLACPAQDCEVVGMVEPGQVLNVVSSEGPWYEISLEDESVAYIEIRYTQPQTAITPTGTLSGESGGPPGLPPFFTTPGQTAPVAGPPGLPTVDPGQITPSATPPFGAPPGLPTAYSTSGPPPGPPITITATGQATTTATGSVTAAPPFPPGYSTPTPGTPAPPLPPGVTPQTGTQAPPPGATGPSF